MHAARKALASKRKQDVLEAIEQMVQEGREITFYSVAKVTGASRNYLYTNDEIRSAIESTRHQYEPKPQNPDIIIKGLKRRVKELEKTLAEADAENSDSYKKRYDELLLENKRLKAQLRAAYRY